MLKKTVEQKLRFYENLLEPYRPTHPRNPLRALLVITSIGLDKEAFA